MRAAALDLEHGDLRLFIKVQGEGLVRIVDRDDTQRCQSLLFTAEEQILFIALCSEGLENELALPISSNKEGLILPYLQIGPPRSSYCL
jgi:hypothetical protein